MLNFLILLVSLLLANVNGHLGVVIQWQTYYRDMFLMGKQVKVSTHGVPAIRHSGTSISSGRWVFVWQAYYNGRDCILAKVYGNNHKALYNQIVVDNEDENFDPKVIASDEGFIVAWTRKKGTVYSTYFRKYSKQYSQGPKTLVGQNTDKHDLSIETSHRTGYFIITTNNATYTDIRYYKYDEDAPQNYIHNFKYENNLRLTVTSTSILVLHDNQNSIDFKMFDDENKKDPEEKGTIATIKINPTSRLHVIPIHKKTSDSRYVTNYIRSDGKLCFVQLHTSDGFKNLEKVNETMITNSPTTTEFHITVAESKYGEVVGAIYTEIFGSYRVTYLKTYNLYKEEIGHTIWLFKTKTEKPVTHIFTNGMDNHCLIVSWINDDKVLVYEEFKIADLLQARVPSNKPDHGFIFIRPDNHNPYLPHPYPGYPHHSHQSSDSKEPKDRRKYKTNKRVFYVIRDSQKHNRFLRIFDTDMLKGIAIVVSVVTGVFAVFVCARPFTNTLNKKNNKVKGGSSLSSNSQSPYFVGGKVYDTNVKATQNQVLMV